jgi:membrane protease YdiL (CAAX protease family)
MMASDTTTFGRNGQGKMSGPQLIVLHLLPGLIFAGFFFLLSSVFIKRGLTGYLALLVSIPVCLAPIELGVMLFWSARFTASRSLSRAIAYRRKGTAVEYIGLPLLLFMCWGVLSILINPVSQYLAAHLTFWLPVWTTQQALITGLASSSPAQRSIALGLGVLLSGFVAPVVEELYFRGFLLPRMEHWGWLAPVLNSLLFAVYHFYFPENVPGIFVAFVPISYIVMLKKDWRIGALVHCLFNLWGVFSLARLVT